MTDLLNDLIPTYHLARVRMRWVAAFIDYLILLCIWVVLVYIFGKEGINEDGTTSYGLDGFPGFVCITIPWFVLFPIVETITHGQSIGKMVCSLRIVTVDQEKAGFGAFFLRRLFDWADYLPFGGIVGVIVAANTQRKQRIGDLVARTIVVKA
ncbi:MAG: RDD family protein [Chitinophagaceae bacterium]